MDWTAARELLPLLQLKWTVPILDHLRGGPRRVRELRDELEISGKVLAQSLAGLIDKELVLRCPPGDPERPVGSYALTRRGRAVAVFLDALDDAGRRRGFDPLPAAASGPARQAAPASPAPAQPGPALREPVPPGSALPDPARSAVARRDRGGPARAGRDSGGRWESLSARSGPVPGFERPNTARMYDYYLGGKENFAADRRAADMVIEKVPHTPQIALENRRFLGRAIQYLTTQGIRQFIDFGSGLPTQQNVHEIVHLYDPRARVVYVDNDPIVLAHARALLSDTAQTSVIDGDLRRLDNFLVNPVLVEQIDFSRPVGVLLVSVLHCLSDADDPWRVTATIRDHVAPGSHLVISHTHRSENSANKEQLSAGSAVYRSMDVSTPMVIRDEPAIRALFTGLDLADPGLRWLPDWHPELDSLDLSSPWPVPDDPIPRSYLCGVGRKPHP